MAGSRLDRVGTIYSRATGLLKAGGIKFQDRPLWYDIYRVFPPKYEPHIDRQSEKKEVMNLLYKEDKFRALFFKKFGHNPGGVARNLSDKNFEEPSQSFVTLCLKIEKNRTDWNENQVFEGAVEEYRATRALDKRKDASEFDKGSVEDDVIDERSASRRHGRKPPTISAQSLLSLFKEAKEQQEKDTKDESQSKNTDTKASE